MCVYLLKKWSYITGQLAKIKNMRAGKIMRYLPRGWLSACLGVQSLKKQELARQGKEMCVCRYWKAGEKNLNFQGTRWKCAYVCQFSRAFQFCSHSFPMWISMHNSVITVALPHIRLRENMSPYMKEIHPASLLDAYKFSFIHSFVQRGG